MYKHTKKEIGSVIKGLRLSRGQTQSDLADYLDTTQQTVARWESGESQPDLDTFFHILDMYQVHDVLHTFGYGGSIFPSYDSSVLFAVPYFKLIEEFCERFQKDSKAVFDYFFLTNSKESIEAIFVNGKPKLPDENAVAKLLNVRSHEVIYLWGEKEGIWDPSLMFAQLSADEKAMVLAFRQNKKEVEKTVFSAG